MSKLSKRDRPAPRLADRVSSTLPPAVVSRHRDSVRQLWMSRVHQSVQDFYAGAPLSKFPEDLRVYEHLIWESNPSAVIEIGSYHGGSALWFRDRLRTLASYGRIRDPIVVSVEVEPERAVKALDAADPHWPDSIKLIAGDVRDPTTIGKVADLVPPGTQVLVTEDCAHVYETTRAALEGFAGFVQPGGYFVVEDGCVDIDELRLHDDWPRGVLQAVRDWLRTDPGYQFCVRRDLELYGLTSNPEGFLQRLR